MAIITPPTINELPPPPVKGQAGFNSACETYFNALVNPFTPQLNAAISATNANALSAQASAISAQLSAVTANATQWASGSYATGAAVWSPASLAAGVPTVYVRKSPGGASPTDPQNDPANWVKYNQSNTNGFTELSGQNMILDRNSPYCIQFNAGCGARAVLSENPLNNQTGVRHFFNNISPWAVRIVNSAGDLLGFLSSMSSATIYFNGTSWGGDLKSYGASAYIQAAGMPIGSSKIIDAIEIDDYRTMFVIGGVNGSALYGFVWDDLSGWIGGIIQIRASAHHAKAVKTNDGNILVASCDNATNMQAVIVNISGTTISLGTSAQTTISSNILSFGKLINNNGNYVLSYNRDNSGNKYGIIRGIAISGGPIFGIDVVLSGFANETPRLYQSGEIVRVIVSTIEGLYVAAFNQSGATLSAAGTSASESSTDYYAYRSIKMQNGNIAALHYSAGYFKVSIFSNSGGNESCYSVVVADVFAGGNSASISIEIEPLSSNKLAVFATASTYSNLFVSTVTDNGGSATALNSSISTPHNGGELSFLFGSSFLSDYFGVALTYQSYSHESHSYYFGFPSSPVFYHYVSNGNLSIETKPATRGLMGELDGSMLQNNDGVFNIIKTIDGDIYSPIIYGFLGRYIDNRAMEKIKARPSIRGKNNRVAYSIIAGNNGYGFAIERIELKA